MTFSITALGHFTVVSPDGHCTFLFMLGKAGVREGHMVEL